jgi:hypothetical protein
MRGQILLGVALALGICMFSGTQASAYTGYGYLPRAYADGYDRVRARRYYRPWSYRAARRGWRYRAFSAPLH